MNNIVFPRKLPFSGIQRCVLKKHFAWLIFYPEGGGDMFLRSIVSYTGYMVLYPRRWKLSLTTAVETSNPTWYSQVPFPHLQCKETRKSLATQRNKPDIHLILIILELQDLV
jgi:hypothetical protein